MIPYFENKNGVLYNGDAIDVAKWVKPESVQCVVTSPPYWGKVRYGDWTVEEVNTILNSKRELGWDITPQEYVDRIVKIFQEIRKVLHPSGTVWLNISDTNCVPSSDRETIFKMKPGVKAKNRIGIPWKVAFALQEDGWWLRSDNIWWKKNAPRRAVKDRPTYEHEYIFLLSKSEIYFYDNVAVQLPYIGYYAGDRSKISIETGNVSQGGTNLKSDLIGRNLGSVWDIPTEGRTDPHYAAFPDKLASTAIKAGTSLQGCCSKCYSPLKRTFTQDNKVGANGRLSPKKEVGWKPTCNCGAEVIPCTVLDPFSGRGTTLLVAEKLNRRWIGIEVYKSFCALIKQNMVVTKFGLKPLSHPNDGLIPKEEIDLEIKL